MTILSHHIGNVLCSRSKKQVVRIATPWIIAFMENAKRSIPIRIREKINEAMSRMVLALSVCVNGGNAVSEPPDFTRPVPAFIWTAFVDSTPETFKLSFCQLHKKATRQSKCADGSFGLRQNIKVVSGSCSTDASKASQNDWRVST